VAYAEEKFDENGGLKDAKTKKKIVQMLENLIAWTLRLKKDGSRPI
jgi:hypothetical protein